jgi:hypothetical protein
LRERISDVYVLGGVGGGEFPLLDLKRRHLTAFGVPKGGVLRGIFSPPQLVEEGIVLLHYTTLSLQ